MDKSQSWKIILIIVLVVVSAWTLYPASKTLKPGIDLAGGTSLIYQIDTQGLEESEKREISGRMITVLRRRLRDRERRCFLRCIWTYSLRFCRL